MSGKKKYKSDFERLEVIKNKFMEKIEKNEITLKVGDFLKILELQKRLSEDASAERKFWEIIEEIRQEELRHE